MGWFVMRKRRSETSLKDTRKSSTDVLYKTAPLSNESLTGSRGGDCWSARAQSQCLAPGAQHVNEDRLVACDSFFTANRDEGFFFAVADGHGGERCASFAVANLGACLAGSPAWQAKATSPRERLRLAVLDAFRRLEASWMDSARATADTSGACLAMGAFCGGNLCVANVGDCEALLVLPDGSNVELSRPHRASDPDEAARVVAAGGAVIKGRIFGAMEPSRSIGDLDVKLLCPGAVVAEPFVSERELPNPLAPGSAGAPALAIASDGVWDRVTKAKAGSIVRAALAAERRGASKANAAQELVRAALRAGTKDDAAAVVVLFERGTP